MSVESPDRRTARRDATRRDILDAAWELARERGVGAWTMRDLGARVGMRAQSIYVYFDSKHALLDAMYADGFSHLLCRTDAVPGATGPRENLRRHTHCFIDFACEDLARYQLLFQRVVPGFEPSAASYAVSVESLGRTRSILAACGITRARDIDLYTGVTAGIVAQQNSNEPGGNRWKRLVDEVLDMYLAHVLEGDK
jgi:AcrR family transcriptional regulator